MPRIVQTTCETWSGFSARGDEVAESWSIEFRHGRFGSMHVGRNVAPVACHSPGWYWPEALLSTFTLGILPALRWSGRCDADLDLVAQLCSPKSRRASISHHGDGDAYIGKRDAGRDRGCSGRAILSAAFMPAIPTHCGLWQVHSTTW
jgi:hypothetical protein